MQALCCCSSRGFNPGRDITTPTAQLPARPAQARLPRARLGGQNHDGPAVMVTTLAPSLVATPRQQAVLDPTVIEIDDSDSEDEPFNLRTPPITALGALKTKLIRRLSQKSQSNRQSQQSIGSSEEELARRAELRRLRQKRIQEELSTENDVANKDFMHAPSRRTSPSPSERADITGSGPRDAIEFSVCDIDTATSNSSDSPAREMIAVALPIVAGNGTSLRRHGSCPRSAPGSCKPSATQDIQVAREHDAIPRMPPSPQIEPVDTSDSCTTSSVASWRLSYSAAHLAEYIGTLPDVAGGSKKVAQHASDHQPTTLQQDAKNFSSRKCVDRLPSDACTSSRSSTQCRTDHENKSFAAGSHADEFNFEQSTAILHDTTHSEHFSPLDLWLRVSNTLQSISHSSTRRNSDSVLESRLERPLLSDMNTNAKTPRERPSSSSSKIGTSQDLLKASSRFPTNENISASVTRSPSSMEQLDQHTTTSGDDDQSVAIRVPSPDLAPTLISSERTPAARCHATKDGPRDSKEVGCDKSSSKIFNDDSLVVTNDIGPERFETGPAQTLTKPALASGHEKRQLTPPELAPLSANTRAEPAEMQTASVESQGQLQVSEAIDSRLRPVVEMGQEQSTRKSSLFARLFLNRAKPRNTLRKQRSEGNHSKNEKGSLSHQTAPSNSQKFMQVSRRQRFSNEGADLKLEETATDLWQRAVRLEAERREGRNRSQSRSGHENQSQLESQNNHGLSGNDAVRTRPHTREASSVYSRSPYEDGSGVRSPSSRPLTGQDKMQLTRVSLESSNQILKEWQHQVHTEQSDAERTIGFRTHIYATQSRHGVPESWARWPSHNREERNGVTGVDDLVTPKDFAVAETSMTGPTKWATDKEIEVNGLDEGYVTPDRRSFSSKIGRTLRESLAKLLPDREGPNASLHNFSSHARKRPASSGSLEYPELELLPHHGGYKELEALEKTIDHLKRPSMASGTRSRRLSGASSRTPLSLRFAQEVQNLRHDDRPGSPDTCDLSSRAALQPPNTPVEKRELSQARSGTSQQYGTPLTHVSYDDCVPTHMLDENDSAKSDADLAVRRSKSVLDLATADQTRRYDTWNGRSKSVLIKRLRASRSE